MLKINIGHSRKIGEPSYGSRGASVNLELEADTALLADRDHLQEKIRWLFSFAKQSVDHELNGKTTELPASETRTNGRAASQKQLDFARQLAGQIPGLGVRQLDDLAKNVCGVNAEGLTSLQASQVIDSLKAIKSGDVDVANALGAAT